MNQEPQSAITLVSFAAVMSISNTEWELSMRQRGIWWRVRCLYKSSGDSCPEKRGNPSQRLAKCQYTLTGEVEWKVQYIPGERNVFDDGLRCLLHFSEISSSLARMGQ